MSTSEGLSTGRFGLFLELHSTIQTHTHPYEYMYAPADLEILEIAYHLTHNTGKSWKIRKFRKMYEYQDLNPGGQRRTGPSYHWTTSTIANSNRSWNLKEDLKDFWCRHQSLNPGKPWFKEKPGKPWRTRHTNGWDAVTRHVRNSDAAFTLNAHLETNKAQTHHH
jgi:hypothetical protein